MAARCARHGLAIAPDGTCVRCRREAEEAAEAAQAPSADETTRRRAAIAALCLVLVAIVVALVVIMRPRTAPSAPAPIASASTPPAPEDAPPLLPLVSAKLPADAPPRANAPGSSDDRLQTAMHAVPITLYGTPESGDCKRARAWLLANGYAFADRDVAHDPSADRARRALTGSDALPVLDVGGQPLTGFDPSRVTRALEYAAARRLQH